jgi:hypothetical protein
MWFAENYKSFAKLEGAAVSVIKVEEVQVDKGGYNTTDVLYESEI